MTAGWVFCRDGSRHFGHVDAWGDGRATFAGTVIDGVVFVDFVHRIGSGGTGPAPGDVIALATRRRPAAATRPPAAVPEPDEPGVMSAAAGSLVRATGDRLNHQTASIGEATAAACDSDSVTSPAGVARDGQGTPVARSVRRWTCTCGHSQLAHHRWGPCARQCLCDAFRFATSDAAGPEQPTAS